MTVEASADEGVFPLVAPQLRPADVIVPTRRPPVSVIICTYTELRLDDLRRSIESVVPQLRSDDELIVVVDHNERLLRVAEDSFPHAQVIRSDGAKGLSGARNTGVSVAQGDVLVFIDDDASAEPNWLDHMLAPYATGNVMGVGGAALPDWPEGRPSWFPPEFDWVVGCSYVGLPTALREVRNPIGASMSFRRTAFELAGTFREGIGRSNATPMGCEETEFGIRLRQASPGAIVLYEPMAAVRHRVTAERTTFRYFWRRCHAEGLSKALVASSVGQNSALATERTYVRQTLPRALWREVVGRGALARAGVIVVGVLVTTAGYGTGLLRQSALFGQGSGPVPTAPPSPGDSVSSEASASASTTSAAIPRDGRM